MACGVWSEDRSALNHRFSVREKHNMTRLPLIFGQQVDKSSVESDERHAMVHS